MTIFPSAASIMRKSARVKELLPIFLMFKNGAEVYLRQFFQQFQFSRQVLYQQ
jgi:hypothetical protein